ncbi:hypothetical protein FAIPA1_10261 [Frankia sp. AiPs1]|nr:zinc-binding dehydrogenase [Frankia sp. AiPa1]
MTAVDRTNVELAARTRATGRRFAGIAVDPDAGALRQLVELVEQGRLRIHVGATFPFERIAEAHRQLESGHTQGKIVLTVGQ